MPPSGPAHALPTGAAVAAAEQLAAHRKALPPALPYLLSDLATARVSYRMVNVFRRLGVRTVGELARQTADAILRCPGAGPVVLFEVRRFLAAFGLGLRGDGTGGGG